MRANLIALSLAIGVAGCATTQQAAPPPPAPILTQQTEEKPPPPRRTGADVIAEYPAHVRSAIYDHRIDKDWPHYSENGRLLWPFADNLPMPVVTCTPLHSTDIALQPGETISDVALGDAVRWMAAPASSGNPQSPTPHVSIKCTDPGLDTSLDVYTTTRVYRFDLKSRGAGGMMMISFYYPEDILARMAEADATPAQSAIELADPALPDPSGMDFAYQISGPDVPWKPVRAFADAKHRVFIQMPHAMAYSEAPALMLKNGSGVQLVNYRKHGDYYVVDRLFSQAELVSGVGRSQDKVLIEHTEE